MPTTATRYLILVLLLVAASACGHRTTTKPLPAPAPTTAAAHLVVCRTGHPAPAAVERAGTAMRWAISTVQAKISRPYNAGLLNPAEPALSTPAIRDAERAASVALLALRRAAQVLETDTGLCRRFADPLSSAIGELSTLSTDLHRGNIAAAAVLETSIDRIIAVAHRNGLDLGHS